MRDSETSSVHSSSENESDEEDKEAETMFEEACRDLDSVVKITNVVERFAAAKQKSKVVRFIQRQLSKVKSNAKYSSNSQQIVNSIQNTKQLIGQERIKDAINNCNWIIRHVEDPYGGESRETIFEVLTMRANLFRSGEYYMKEVKDKLYSYQYFGAHSSWLRRWKSVSESLGKGNEDNPFLSFSDDMAQHDEYFDSSNDFYSDAMILQEQEGQGRFVVAGKDIEQKTELIREKAYAVEIEPEFILKVCSRCLTPLHDQHYPCPRCPKVAFCSPRCAFIGWRSHRYVCGFIDVQPEVTLGTNCIARIGIEKAIQLYSRYLNGERYNIFDLQPTTNEEDRFMAFLSLYDGDDVLRDIVKATRIVYACLNHTIVEQKGFMKSLSEDEKNKFGALLVKIFETAIINAFTVYEKITELKYPKPSAEFDFSRGEDDIATAFVIKSSLFNHNCNENTSWHITSNGIQTFRTRQKIKQGNQITINYGYSKLKNNWPERQEGLWETYRFKCACRMCESEKEQYRGNPKYEHLFEQTWESNFLE